MTVSTRPTPVTDPPVDTATAPAGDPLAATPVAPATPVTPAASAAPVAAPATASPAKKRSGFGRFVGILIGLAVLGAGGYFGYNYWQDSQRFVSTDDALVDSNLVAIASPSSGTLTNWRLQPGDTVRAGQVIGTVRVTPTGGAAPLINIIAPQDGTILKVDGKEGQVIGAASSIAYMADLSGLRITAYIDEGDVHRLQVGQPVEVTVDGTGSQVYDGTVAEIIPAVASQFALIQSQDRGSGNFTKVSQRVEVHVSIGDTTGLSLYPGMNAHVKIAVV